MRRSALLVEDNSSHAVLIADELSAALPDWTIDAAGTVVEARRRIAQQQHDLYVIDFMLPDGDGLALLREIRSHGTSVPVLFLTTAASARIAGDALKLGA